MWCEARELHNVMLYYIARVLSRGQAVADVCIKLKMYDLKTHDLDISFMLMGLINVIELFTGSTKTPVDAAMLYLDNRTPCRNEHGHRLP